MPQSREAELYSSIHSIPGLLKQAAGWLLPEISILPLHLGLIFDVLLACELLVPGNLGSPPLQLPLRNRVKEVGLRWEAVTPPTTAPTETAAPWTCRAAELARCTPAEAKPVAFGLLDRRLRVIFAAATHAVLPVRVLLLASK